MQKMPRHSAYPHLKIFRHASYAIGYCRRGHLMNARQVPSVEETITFHYHDSARYDARRRLDTISFATRLCHTAPLPRRF